MSIIVVSFLYLFILGTIGFVLIGIPFLRIVNPSTIVSIPILLGLCTYQLILKFRNCYTSYFSCTNRIIYINGFIISAILCVILSFIMIGPLNLGIWGLIIAQIISQVIYNMWYWPLKAHRELELSMKEMIIIGNSEIIKIIKSLVIRY